jgi:protein-tyrosine-phosphatase
MLNEIGVELAAEDAVTELVGRVVAGLGADLVVTGSESEFTTIGDRTLPASPPDWHVEAAALRSLRPGHILFLCVANSARSQLAEGIARSLASPEVKISSAGSVPTSVRPQAVAVLSEIGIDISDHVSTGIDYVARPVDAVITLCEEEVCPVWLEDARRLHWGLPDPAGVEGTDDEQLEAFRSVRDELRRRLRVLL